ncbi:unnamed protein product [Paramecium sonneborni]|uniref:Uncharacterized protein n=1 Tax=Paramecium sonneborni TaxID=65129 RepID=A0A8S1KV02_9CILI|nr:unnamed protein product [Paramecium sonneborni]
MKQINQLRMREFLKILLIIEKNIQYLNRSFLIQKKTLIILIQKRNYLKNQSIGNFDSRRNLQSQKIMRYMIGIQMSNLVQKAIYQFYCQQSFQQNILK